MTVQILWRQNKKKNLFYTNTRAHYSRCCINTHVFKGSKFDRVDQSRIQSLTLSRSLQQGIAAKISQLYMVPRTKLEPSHGWVQKRQRTGCPPLPSKQLMHTADKNCVRPSTFTWNKISQNRTCYWNLAHGKNDFAEVSKNFARYKSENNLC